ncbi:putative transport protein Avl9 [Lyophyllum shimeji]|uniref:Transport protein Avl9 n=1 Tax=Lyophyllum shimeji TaxID=47721 RepID=A0A9P3PNG0_LYOSH|nr:putative transport protein Avl9 [Lyophyllum shimeji]
MASFLPEPSPAPVHDIHGFLSHEAEDDDADTASQRSIPLSSPNNSPRQSALHDLSSDANFRDSGSFSKRESTVDTEFGSDADGSSMFSRITEHQESPDSSAAPSVYDEPKEANASPLPTYPPSFLHRDDRSSVSSFASGSSRKTRPESLLVNLPNGPLIHGVALVDFNHLIGPRIEYSKGEIFENEEVAKILPFLALPDGAHLSAEDYSYFHLVPSGPNPTTIFGISCNQQIPASALLVKPSDVTRSTVQKAVVVLASKPVFGPIRDKLGVVTTALFNQRDFTDASILDDFASSLELSLRGQLTESGLYMGTSLRELVHVFRQRTLVLVKALMLQKRIMFYGHPVERLCTYQYSLVSLLPGLLQTLDDCGSPPLASRAPTLERPSSLKTSDHKSMMAFMGLPLDIFGKDAFFQPYLPLQQLDVLKETASWLCGSTNSIVTHQKEIDLLVNIETGVFEFRNPLLERAAGLTAADRKWMDEIVTDVNGGWDDHSPRQSLQRQIRFKGSDDYLRTKFEEYMSAALSTVKYQDFVAKGEGSGVLITGGSGGDSTSAEDFNPLWIAEFRKTNAYEVWDRITDPLIFDIVEPRHPCNEKPSVVADIGLRLQEGIQELKLEQQLAPAREAVTRAVSVGSTNFFKAVEGMRDRWAQRSDASSTGNSRSSTPVEVSKADLEGAPSSAASPPSTSGGLRPFTLLSRGSLSDTTSPATTPTQPLLPSLASPSKNLASWGAGIGSFLNTHASKFSIARRPSEDGSAAPAAPTDRETKTVPAPPPEPEPKIKAPPPPVQVVNAPGNDDGTNNDLRTPQPFKTPAINVTSPGGSTPGLSEPEPPTPTATTASTPTTTPTPTPQARVTRRPSQNGRPAAGLWEDHGDVLDGVPEGGDEPSSRKAEALMGKDADKNEKVAKNGHVIGTQDGRRSTHETEDDVEDAYTGMAL